MKRIVLAALAVVAFTGTASADPFSGLYGNTVTITAPDGKSSTGYVNADMTWERHTPDGAVIKGTFSFQDANTVCFTQLDPAPPAGTAANCSKVEDHKVGDTWTIAGPGGSLTYTATAGR